MVTDSDIEFLRWIRDIKLVDEYGNSPNVDFVLQLTAIIEDLDDMFRHRSSDKVHLSWVRDRLVHRYHEDAGSEHIQRLDNIITMISDFAHNGMLARSQIPAIAKEFKL